MSGIIGYFLHLRYYVILHELAQSMFSDSESPVSY